jgi:hypothetical protein
MHGRLQGSTILRIVTRCYYRTHERPQPDRDSDRRRAP